MLGLIGYGQLTANFSADDTSGCAPLIVHFQNLSTGGATSYQWDLGNGTLSSQVSPTTTYLIPGSYTIKLVAITSTGKDSLIKVNHIIVNDAPTVNFVTSTTSGCYPLRVQFTDISVANSGTNVDWFWDFGDGNTSPLQNPMHTYLVAGNFGVTLRVKNSAGCTKILNKQNLINISGGAKANFSVGTTTGCGVPASVGFTNTSTGTGTLSYQWFFGDGGTSTATSPSHSYTASGNYTVTLITSNSQGCSDTLIKQNIINIGNVAASFTSVGTCVGTPVVFTNTSTPAPVSIVWYFDDGTTSTQINPVKLYTVANTYNVKLVVDFGACKDSIFHPITIQPKPTASFAPSVTGACSPPLPVSFTNTSTSVVSYQWLFGDGGVSSQPNPSYTYLQSGSFDVTLIATNAFGCTDTLKNAGAIRISPPVIVRYAGEVPYKGCAPYTSTFGAVINTPEPIVLYEWNFGDGSPIQNGANPSHTYNNTGIYAITLIVTSTSGCKDTFALPDAIILSTKPVANFTATPRSGCAQDIINFTSLSSGSVDAWFWNFGDGGTSVEENPMYNYTDTGYFQVTLIVQNNSCKDTLKIPKYIYINPPIAKFEKLFNCDTPLQRRFINKSIGAVTYVWDFGDGTFDNIPSPVHTYLAAGVYNVKLTVSNGICTHFAYDTLRVSDGRPNFTVNGSSFCKYADVVFTVNSVDTASIVSYLWDFGDGFNSTTTQPTTKHNYTHSGNVSPSLITTDVLGCKDSVTIQLPIVIYGPTAGFSNTPAGTCINGSISFIDTSTTDGLHPINQWVWNYGDGFTDTLTTSGNTQHQFNAVGSFTIKLKVTDDFGCYDTIVKPSAILITQPIADFNSPDTIKCSNSNVIFNNLSQGINLSYSWSFGDLLTSTNQSPQHPYIDTGRYSVQLAISDLFGCTDTIFKPLYIHVANPKAKFSFLQGDSLGLCYPFLIEVANEAKNAQSISWNFGDGGFSNLDTPSHFYNYVGFYPLTLRAYGFGGCVDSVTTKVEVRGPTGTFSYGPLKFCSPDTVYFTAFTKNNATFVWDFSDGNIVTTPDSTVSHVFQAPGRFKPKMILIDAAGCQVLITGSDTITVAGVNTRIKLPQTNFCDSVRVNFIDSTTVTNDFVAGYVWNFGDGSPNSTLHQPQHFYSTPGNYVVSLTVNTSLGCTYIDTLAVPIKVVQTPVIKIDGDSVACVNTLLNYVGTILKSDTAAITWKWSLGNGNTSNLQNPPPQFYAQAATYTITAMSSNASGCADTVNKSILIHPLPNTDAGLDSVVCKGKSIVLQPTGAATYIWDANPFLSCTNCTNPTATPDSIRWYKVTGFNSFGCFLADSLIVDVIKPFKIKVSLTDTICVGESAQLLATGNGIDNFVWTPTTGLNNSLINNPIASTTLTTNYQVVATDKRKCFNDTGNVLVKVYPFPQFNIVESIIKANVGSIVPIVTTSSADVTSWKWLPERLLSCINCAMPNATIKENIKYVAEASNPGGCKTRDEVTIETLCANNNIFIPNTFSPNGDGANDVFYPRGKGLYKIKSMRVFNRWGEIVFSKDNFAPNDATQGWDGTYKGVKLSSDVYVYTIEVLCDNNQIIPLKGDIALLK